MKTKSKSSLYAWVFLIIAIITEVLGSSSLKIVKDIDFGFIISACIICASYYFIGLAVKSISISIAYAVWEVLGMICIACIGVFYFKENLSLLQIIGIILGLSGIVLINIGEIGHTKTQSTSKEK